MCDEYQPNDRVRQATMTEEKLIELAKMGFSKSHAAKALGITRAGVTIACKRNSELNKMFLNFRSS
jgi:predicted transcriptional regulator